MPTAFITAEQRKKLYYAAQALAAPHERRNADTVKLIRDSYIASNYPNIEHYSQLTEKQANHLISLMLQRQEDRNRAYKDSETSKHKHQRMVAKLMAVSLETVLINQNFDSWEYILQTGVKASGEKLRIAMYEMFHANKLPTNMRNRLFDTFVNPRLNKWLMEGGLKHKNTEPNKFYWNSASLEQLHYLIVRADQMLNVVQTGKTDLNNELNMRMN